MNVAEAAEAVWAAYTRNVRPAEAVRGQLDVDSAYKVQKLIIEHFVKGGDKIAGWKIGGNSEGARKAFSRSDPFSGFLLESGRYASGSEFDLSRLPGSGVLECELAFTFKQRLTGRAVTRADVEAALDTVAPAFEIASVGRTSGLDLAQIVSDNVAQWGYVIGKALPYTPGLRLGDIEVIAQRNGEVAVRGLSRDSVDDQIDSLVWLVHNLDELEAAIEPGQIVMSGSCLRPMPIGKEEHWVATFSGIGTVEARFR